MDISRLRAIPCATSWRTRVNTKAVFCELNKLDDLIVVVAAEESLCVEVFLSVARLRVATSIQAYRFDWADNSELSMALVVIVLSFI